MRGADKAVGDDDCTELGEVASAVAVLLRMTSRRMYSVLVGTS